MSYSIISKKLPSIADLQQELPATTDIIQQVSQDRIEVNNILTGIDDRKILIIGPCSAWPFDAVLNYADQLSTIIQQLNLTKKFKIILRAYMQKPRTTHGWAGPMVQVEPWLNKSNIYDGLYYARRLMLQLITKGFAVANEILYPSMPFNIELLSWMAVGARSSENPEHRIFASMQDFAVGIKNPTSGAIDIGINSIIAAQKSHYHIINDTTTGNMLEIVTNGNPYAHLVLRGGKINNTSIINYTPTDLKFAINKMQINSLVNPSIIIDFNHDNSAIFGVKNYKNQANSLIETLNILSDDIILNKYVKGFMLESFIHDGKQDITKTTPEQVNLSGLSITDECLGLEATYELLKKLL